MFWSICILLINAASVIATVISLVNANTSLFALVAFNSKPGTDGQDELFSSGK